MSTRGEQESVHDAVGAYVLGVLDDADATEFEAHLAGCDVCAAHLEEFAGVEPVLAALAQAAPPPGAPASVPLHGTLPGTPPGAQTSGWQDVPVPRAVPKLSAPPAGRVLDGLLGEVAAKRATRRRRNMYVVAAAIALIVLAPFVTYAVTGDGGEQHGRAEPRPTSPAEDSFLHHMDEKVTATDATTRVSATVGIEKKGWGTHAVLELKGVKGPLKCRLVAVSKSGAEEVVTSWSVPKWGYGIADGPTEASKSPLYVHGGAAMDRSEIDRFEVRTFDNQKLVEIDA
ncbi:zf-HC2 domain-containing protein [Streptomyces sp. NPDC047315]|uniref:anti-sigma factor family protein n=1 Tax=Streptomyces sp. NPDC047315 TaxID=3155142 RepID=UPI0033E0B92B